MLAVSMAVLASYRFRYVSGGGSFRVVARDLGTDSDSDADTVLKRG